MSCSIDPNKTTIAEVRDAVNNKITNNWLSSDPNEKTQDVFNRLKVIQDKLTTELVDNTQLTKGYHLDPSGKTMRYVWLDTKELAFKGRTTDITKIKYTRRRGVNTADEETKLPDNEIKANVGTKVHKAIEDLFRFFIANDSSGYLEPIYDKTKVKSQQTILKELELPSNTDWKSLVTEVENNIKFIIETQKKIDPKGKALLQVEATLFNKLKNIGGTADVHVVFSDKTGGLIDWKTITPKLSTLKAGKIVDPNWIPDYKMEDFNAQIPLLMEMGKTLGVTSYRFARVAPIQMNIQAKAKTDPTNKIGQTLTNKIRSVKIGTAANEYLQQIPIILEDTGSKALNESLEDALILRNNLTKRAQGLVQSSPEYKKLMIRIRNLNTSISQLMLSKDFEYVKKEYQTIVNNYLDGLNNITKDIDNPDSPEYLSNDKILDLKADITIFKSIAASSSEFLKTLPNLSEDKKIEYMNAINILGGKTDALAKILQQKLIDRNLSASQQELLKGDKSISWWDKYFRKFSGINNTIFKEAYNKISKANDNTRLSLQSFSKKLKKFDQEIQKWGQSNGMPGFSVYKLLVNEKTGNLHTKIKGDFYDKLKVARDAKDDSFLKKHLRFKDNYKEIYEERKLKFMATNSISIADQDNSSILDDWMKENNPDNINNKVKYSDYWYIYQEIDESTLIESDFNPDFLKIKNNKPLLDYYNFWNDSMEEFRILLDLPYNKIPNNFIPNIKADLVEQYLTGNFTLSTDMMKNMMSVQENVTTYRQDTMTVRTEIDPDTGLAKREVPRIFVNPLINQQGEIDNTLKSFDLSSSIVLFAEMAYNYNNLKEIEANMEALKEILATKGVVETTSDGTTKSISGVNTPNREKSKQSDESKTFEQLVNFHLYGISTQGNELGQLLLKAKNYQQLKQLALAFKSATVNLMGARTNALFEGEKGYFYTKQQFRKSLNDRFRNKELYFALANFFQPYANKRGADIAKEFSSKNKIAKLINYDTLLAAFRSGDEHVDEQVMYSMLQNYTIINGQLTRLTKKDREAGTYKSLLDTSRLEGDDLIIDGIIDKNGLTKEGVRLYSEFRGNVMATVNTIKGGVNAEDLNAFNTTMFGKLVMAFRGWLPALAEERFRGFGEGLVNIFVNNSNRSSLKYSPRTRTITEARYTAILTDQLGVDEKASFRLLGYIAQNVARLGFEVVTFGGFFDKMSATSPLRYQVNEHRARVAFEHFKLQNPNIPAIANGTYRFEDFLEYKQGQIKALATELRFILGIYFLLGALAGGGDDDEKYYKKNLATREFYRTLNRYRRELVGIINPADWYALFKNPIPIMALGDDFIKTLGNTFDESLDIFGEAEGRSLIHPLGKTGKKAKKKDDTPLFYYSFKWLYGFQLAKLFEPFERDKNNEY
jgi:hypothetical protein